MKITTFDLITAPDSPLDFEAVWNWLDRNFVTPWPDTSLQQSKACGFQTFNAVPVDEARSEALVAHPIVPFSFATVRKNVTEAMVDDELKRNLKGDETPEEIVQIRTAIHIALLDRALPELTRINCGINLALNKVYLCSGSADATANFETIWNMNADKDGGIGKVAMIDFDRVLTCNLTEDDLRWFKAVNPVIYGCSIEDRPDLYDDSEQEAAHKYDCGQDFLMYLTMKTGNVDEPGIASFDDPAIDFVRGKAASFANRGKGRCTIRTADDFLTRESETAMKVGKKLEWAAFEVELPGVQAEIKLDKTLNLKGFKRIEDKDHPMVYDYATEELASLLISFESVRSSTERLFMGFVMDWIEEVKQPEIAEWVKEVCDL